MHHKRPTPRSSVRLALLAATALASLAAGPALAQGSPFYGGLNLATPKWDEPVGGLSGNNSGTGLKVYGGWQATPHLALEAGAMSLGRLDTATGDVKGRGLFLDAVGSWPLDSQFSLLGRAGVVHAKTTVPGASDSGFGLKFGAGAQVQLNPQLAVRAEWERYRLDAFGGHPKTDQLSLGLKMNF